MGTHDPLKLEVFPYIAVLFSFAICMNAIASNAQRPGFLSIDCGSNRAAYTDDIGLNWVNDGNLTLTGTNGNSQVNVSSTPNYKALRNFRFFPEPRNKHCYELPTSSNTSYLVRAMFYYIESKELPLPIQFNVFINATNWFTVTYNDINTSMTTPLTVEEGIFYSPGSVMYVCLQPLIGSVPFISSLELRPLDTDGSMYNYSGSTQQYLPNLIRYNFGYYTIRYPDDPFDRIWNGYMWDGKTVRAPAPLDTTTSAELNHVPPTVMQDGWVLDIFGPNWDDITFGMPIISAAPVDYAYAALYFQEVNASESGGLGLFLTLNQGNGRSFTVTENASMQAYPNLILQEPWIDVGFTWPPGLTSQPLWNAFELYAKHNFNISTVGTQDGTAVQALQTSFSLTNWQGDPCTPVPHDWLICNSAYASTPTSSDISACGLSGIPNSTCSVHTPASSVTALTLSNLTSRGFSLLKETVAASPGTISLSLTELSLTNSEIDAPTFQFLINGTFFQASSPLIKLDVSYNAITTFPRAAAWPQPLELSYLNLSHNALDGELPSFDGMPFVNSLLELNLSYNDMTSLPTKWGNITSLVVLDISHNNLAGDISSLDELVTKNSGSLRSLIVSDNNLTGTFSNPLYFSGLPNLTIANFDRNLIEGTLDLSAWYNSLKEAVLNPNASGISQLFSFVNNSISNINPSAGVLQTTIESLQEKIPDFNKTSVLLGGNPYCKHPKSYTQQYLCRFTITEKIPGKRKQSLIILIFSIIGGVLAFLLFSVLITIIFRLWKQVKALREIEKALADQQVQPRFYSYNDLKSATKDFHVDNKLGKGAFGVVYKGELSDGTMLAVKKLSNSVQEAQVLNDFLNEVVLITGIQHKNLVQLKGCCIEHKQRILVYDYVENGNLSEALWGTKVHKSLSWEQCWDICVGVARGLSYLHEELQPCLIHRDIKPANILIDKHFQPKIADFGLARPFADELTRVRDTQIAGTLGYLSPEYATQGQLTEKADVYSYGIVVLEIVSGRKCIDISLPTKQLYLRDWARTMHKDNRLLDLVQPQLRERCVRERCVEAEVLRAMNIGLLCVQTDPQRRPTMSQVVTMFLRSTDMTLSLNNSDRDPGDFKNFVVASDSKMQSFSLQNLGIIEEVEESDEFPLLNTDSQYNNSRTNNGSLSYELMSMTQSGR